MLKMDGRILRDESALEGESMEVVLDGEKLTYVDIVKVARDGGPSQFLR